MGKVRYEQMRPHEVLEARGKCPVAYLPIGTIEWHGPQLPLGLDTVKIHRLALRCAEAGGGLVFPPLYYGESRETMLMEACHDEEGKIVGAMGLPRDSFRPGYMKRPPYQATIAYNELLVHILFELQSLGFKVVIIMAGHYPLIHNARAAIETYKSCYGKCQAWAVTGYEIVQDKIPDAGDHAGKWETSLGLELLPEFVDLSRLPTDPDEAVIGTSGGNNDPRNASPEYGKKGVELVVQRIKAKVEELLAAAG